jgi:hypothetical protein
MNEFWRLPEGSKVTPPTEAMSIPGFSDRKQEAKQVAAAPINSRSLFPCEKWGGHDG